MTHAQAQAEQVVLNLVASIARIEMDRNGLTHWQFGWLKAKRTLGLCEFLGGYQSDVGVISLSRHYVLMNDLSLILDTIRHEIAHALTPGHGHDMVWRMKCVGLGAKGRMTKKARIEYRYRAYCPCGCHQWHMHRVTPKYLMGRCPSCKERVQVEKGSFVLY